MSIFYPTLDGSHPNYVQTSRTTTKNVPATIKQVEDEEMPKQPLDSSNDATEDNEDEPQQEVI